MKGIKIFGVLAIASLLFSANAFAQENNNRDENGKVVRGAYETNKAFDNTFIGIGAGINTVVPSITAPKNWGKIGLAADLNFGKWWTPAIGMRLGYHGLWDVAKANAINGTKTGDKFGFHYIHGDLLWNISNTIGGYKETRFWDFVPYATMGVLDVCKGVNPFKKGASNNFEYAAGAGLINVLRLSNRVNLTIDLMALVGKAAAYTNGAGRLIVFPSATAGLQFNLGKTNFDRHSTITPVVIPVPFTTEQYNALKDKVAALEKENAALKDKIALLEKEVAPLRKLVNGQTYLYENGTFTAVDVKAGAPISIYFDLGSAKISAREKAHLEYFTNNIATADTKVEVNGYADKATGSVKTNQALSEKRAKAVVDLLKKAGMPESNIECKANGGVDIFNTPAYKNRVVTIEIK
ncbi:MAG: OmpA family protein [Bacteroidales bacterium]|nr:OmpA family protein [Bacteroidales bacterium]